MGNREDKRRWRWMLSDVYEPYTGRAALLIIALVLMAALMAIAFVDATAEGVMYTVTVDDYANIREEPSKGSADIGDLYAGDAVAGVGYQAGWVQVEASVEAGTGWVREDLLTLADYPAGKYTNTSGGRVNIRKTPYADEDNHAHWLDSGRSVDVIRWVGVDGVAWAVTGRGYIYGTCMEVAP